MTFDRVSKRYRLGTPGTLRATLAAFARSDQADNGPRDLWALKDVSFRVEPGEALGLIGPNGAGKTTTLRLLSNITRPTSGQVHVSGRTSSLIELGAGFHPELSGRGNIFLNGAILGLKRQEIRRKLDEIIAFSELERFIDTPVKRYSSGMYVRLGFAVAAHVEPDIMLVDEVLAVGDASFRQRCIRRIRELLKNGTTVVFVSHNTHLVRDVCGRALLLAHGSIVQDGSPSDVIAAYERLLSKSDWADSEHGQDGRPGSWSEGRLAISAVDVTQDSLTDDAFDGRMPAQVHIHYRASSPQQVARILVVFYRDDGTVCSAVDSCRNVDIPDSLTRVSGQGVIELTYEPLQLVTGRYYVRVQITDSSDNMVIASGQSVLFHVLSEDGGIYIPKVSWTKTDL